MEGMDWAMTGFVAGALSVLVWIVRPLLRNTRELQRLRALADELKEITPARAPNGRFVKRGQS